MKRGQKIAHSPNCKGGKCRGGCWKQKENKRIVESIREAKERNIHMIVGEPKMGKSAYQFYLGNKMFKEVKDNVDSGAVGHYDVDSMYEKYQKAKEERIAQVTEEQDRLTHWEVLGRLLGKAYEESDDAFFRLLEGFYNGSRNERAGRDALGRRKA